MVLEDILDLPVIFSKAEGGLRHDLSRKRHLVTWVEKYLESRMKSTGNGTWSLGFRYLESGAKSTGVQVLGVLGEKYLESGVQVLGVLGEKYLESGAKSTGVQVLGVLGEKYLESGAKSTRSPG